MEWKKKHYNNWANTDGCELRKYGWDEALKKNKKLSLLLHHLMREFRLVTDSSGLQISISFFAGNIFHILVKQYFKTDLLSEVLKERLSRFKISLRLL